MPAINRVHLVIAGRVQGVGFRYGVVDEARALGLTGWVRNTSNGQVELVAEGPDDRLHRLVTWCHAGPPGALVTHIQPTWSAASLEFTDFRIRR